ncbi:MAG TPA: hypothetical protein VLF69_06345 [Candidatus Saccharimonadales bacterium]|nr:hypothetical protein [Candidatus Saccharimonadales bacterium]
MTEIFAFDSDAEAKAFVRDRVDLPVEEHATTLDSGTLLHQFPQSLSEQTFTNVYDLSVPIDAVRPIIEFPDQLTSVFDYVTADPSIRAATGGGFFFLADQASASPRQLGLNLALAEGHVLSLPVVDREAVLSDGQRLTADHILALGIVSMGNVEVSWSGSLTPHDADARVFSAGNSIITHIQSDVTGSIRVLDESSRYTPAIVDDDTVDIGFIRREDGVFLGVSSSKEGGLDIFTHDMVVRTHERHIQGKLPEMRIRTIGDRAIDGSLQGAVSVGPMLNETDFTNHPINSDKSLGGRPPFLDIPLARTVLYEKEDGTLHIRLFDGRPGSQVFPGVTPRQAAEAVYSEGGVVWGCFLDPGQTAKLAVRTHDDVASYGNTHYLKWPNQPGEKFIWTPRTGRPVASMIITLR